MEFFPLASSSRGNCYLVREGGNLLLIEAGIASKEFRHRSGYLSHRLSGCLISHGHKDHCRGALSYAKCGVGIWCSPATWASLGPKAGDWTDRHHMISPHGFDSFRVGPWGAISFKSVHDIEGALGFFLSSPEGDNLVFITDTGYVRERFAGITHVAIECNWSPETLAPGISPERLERLDRNHLSLEQVIAFLRANDLSRCREIHLLHLSRDNSDARYFRETVFAATGIPVRIAAEDTETIFDEEVTS